LTLKYFEVNSSQVSITRRLLPIISADLAEKMVLLAGPRQCGKTTLAMGLVDQRDGAYFSWDAPAHRRSLQAGALPEDAKLWVFDELHKWRSRRNWLKGVAGVSTPTRTAVTRCRVGTCSTGSTRSRSGRCSVPE
jgi:predicted AAA+ superfamily ATPase